MHIDVNIHELFDKAGLNMATSWCGPAIKFNKGPVYKERLP